MLYFQWDIRAITIITGVYYQCIHGFGSTYELYTYYRAPDCKSIYHSIFWIINSRDYFTSDYAIKKGYGRDTLSLRLITLALLIGIVLGYYRVSYPCSIN